MAGLSSGRGWDVMYLSAQPKAEKDGARERYLFLDKAWAK